MWNVEIARPIPRRVIASVWRRARVRFQLFRRVVQAARVRVRQAHAQSIRESTRQRRLQPVVFAHADRVRVLDVPEIRIRRNPRARVSDNRRLVEIRQYIQMRRTCAHIVQFCEPRVPDLPLHSDAPLLNHRRRIVRVHRPNVIRGQISEIDRRRIEEVRRKSDFRCQHRRLVARQRLVDQKRRIQRKLIFAADALEQ